jgi:hypothetical protein
MSTMHTCLLLLLLTSHNACLRKTMHAKQMLKQHASVKFSAQPPLAEAPTHIIHPQERLNHSIAQHLFPQLCKSCGISGALTSTADHAIDFKTFCLAKE